MHRTYYIYQADTYCQPCGKTLEKDMMRAGELRLDYNDSDGWPQVASTLQGEPDYPDHCAKCDELLGLNLTTEGYEYIKEQASPGNSVTVPEWSD